MNKISAVYEIRCLISHNAYVGSARDVFDRWDGHICDLRKNKHHCKALQLSWQKYGEVNFIFQTLELCSIKDLRLLEQKYLDTGEYVYNSKQYADGPSDFARKQARARMLTFDQRPYWTKERREAAAFRCKERTGKSMSEAAKVNMSIAAKLRCQRNRALGLPGPWTIKRMREPPILPILCACGCNEIIGRKSTWARGHYAR